jgi:integrase
MSADTIKKELGTLSQALEVAQSLLGIELPRGNPVKQVREGLQHTKTMRVNPSRDRRISASEESAILRQLTPLMQSAVALLLETAMRRGELCTAKRAHVSGATLHIPDTKTDQARTIPLSMRALEIMQALPSRSDGLLIGLRPDSVTQAFARACKRAGIVDLRPHDLRHEAVSRLFERGLSIPEVSLVTGHTEWKSLKRYTNLRAEDLVAKLK